MSCLFNTPEFSPNSPHPSIPTATLLFLSQISVLQIPPYPHTTPPLPICSSPVSTFPLQGLTLRLEDWGEKEGERGRKRDRERRESGRPLAIRESAPGWAGFLDMLWGAIVLHVSSPSLLMGPVYHHSDYGRWLGLGGGGVESVDLGETFMCVWEKERVCLGEGGGMKARFGDRGLKTQGPPNPPSTEILALNPSYGIVCCCGDFFLFFCGSHSF